MCVVYPVGRERERENVCVFKTIIYRKVKIFGSVLLLKFLSRCEFQSLTFFFLFG
jgi:hypothetical protein